MHFYAFKLREPLAAIKSYGEALQRSITEKEPFKNVSIIWVEVLNKQQT